MKHFNYLIALSAFLLASCGGSSSSASSAASSAAASSAASSEASSAVSSTDATTSEAATSEASSSSYYDLEALQEEYGSFSLTADDSEASGNISYDSSSNTYTIAVAATKYKYNLTGYFDGQVVIKNSNSLTDFKGVKLSLVNACLVSQTDDSPIDYDVDSKNVEISAKKKCVNYILSYGDAPCIHSENNVEISGKGSLEMASFYEGAHVVDAEGDVTVYEELAITVPHCAHDVFHGENFYSKVDDDGTEVPFSGTMTLSNITKQAFDFETDAVDATITVSGGTITVSNAAAVFKTDVSLLIEEGATVSATGLSGGAVLKSDGSSGVTVTVNGTFLVDGEDYTA